MIPVTTGPSPGRLSIRCPPRKSPHRPERRRTGGRPRCHRRMKNRTLMIPAATTTTKTGPCQPSIRRTPSAEPAPGPGKRAALKDFCSRPMKKKTRLPPFPDRRPKHLAGSKRPPKIPHPTKNFKRNHAQLEVYYISLENCKESPQISCTFFSYFERRQSQDGQEQAII